MVLLLLARVKVVYFDTVKVDQFSLRWSTFLIGSFWKGSFCWLSKTVKTHHSP